MKLGERLYTARISKGVTLIQAAKYALISPGYIHQLEKGIALRPKLRILNALADYYGISRDTVIIEAQKIPEDVYWKIVNNPILLNTIREYDISEF